LVDVMETLHRLTKEDIKHQENEI